MIGKEKMQEFEIATHRERDAHIDILKGIGIILMVGGHCGMPARSFIYLFHMAIFFIASGYCYKSKNSSNIRAVGIFILRKVRALWLPYTLAVTFFSLFHNFFVKLNFLDNTGPECLWSRSDIVHNILKSCLLQGAPTQFGAALWFLKSLLLVSVLYCSVDYIVRRLFVVKYHDVMQLLIALLLLTIGYFFSKPQHFSYTLGRFSYYILFFGGSVISQYKEHFKLNKQCLQIVFFIVSIAVLIYLNHIGKIELLENQYINPLFLLTASFFGWYSISFISNEIFKIGGGKILISLGQNTMAVVILHFLSFKFVTAAGVLYSHQLVSNISAFPVFYKSGCWWLLYLFVGVSLPFCLSILWKKIKMVIIKVCNKK